MNSNSYYWQGQHLATFKSGYLIGRGCANKPGVDGYLSNQIAGLKGQDVIRDHLAAGVATLAGAGVGPRWSGLVGFAGKPGVDLGDELRQLVYSVDYPLFDLLWLNRDRSPDFDRLAWDACAWSSETDARRREGKRKTLIRGFDWVDLAGCLVLLGDSRQRLTDAARKGLGRDVDLMLDSLPARAPKRAAVAAERGLQLYCLRLSGVDAEFTRWPMIADQKPDWEMVARLYRRCSGVDVSAKDLADGLRRRFKALERKTSVIEPSKHWDFDAENRCLAPENEGFTGSERKTSVIEPSKYWGFDAENRCLAPDAGDRCLTLLPEEGLSVRHRPLSPVSTASDILPTAEGNKYPPL